jgi:hypothetical protein
LELVEIPDKPSSFWTVERLSSMYRVNRQDKWDTSGIKVSGHLGACSCFPREVRY